MRKTNVWTTIAFGGIALMMPTFGHAAIVVNAAPGTYVASAETDNSPAAGAATAGAFTGQILTNDLINAGQPTLAGASKDKTPFFETNTVNDGIGHSTSGSDPTTGTYMPVTLGGGDKMPFTYTYDLNASGAAALGYQITEVRSYASWNQNGAGLANQRYELLVSTVGNAGYNSLGTFEFIPFASTSTAEAGATKMVLTDDVTGALATGVDSVRLVFQAHGANNGSAIDGTVYQEVDVIGTPVPEPTLLSLALLGGLGLLARRRRSA